MNYIAYIDKHFIYYLELKFKENHRKVHLMGALNTFLYCHTFYLLELIFKDNHQIMGVAIAQWIRQRLPFCRPGLSPNAFISLY